MYISTYGGKIALHRTAEARERARDSWMRFEKRKDMTEEERFHEIINDLIEKATLNPDRWSRDHLLYQTLRTEHFLGKEKLLATMPSINADFIAAKDNSQNRTLLQMAVIKDDEEALRKIYEKADKDININAQDADGNTALHHAGSLKNKEIMLFLLEKGADCTLKNNKGETVANEENLQNGTLLRIAVMTGKEEIVRKVYDIGVDKDINIDAQDENGNTALHHASFLKNEKMMLFLLANGADSTIANNKGETMVKAVDELSKKQPVAFLMQESISVMAPSCVTLPNTQMKIADAVDSGIQVSPLTEQNLASLPSTYSKPGPSSEASFDESFVYVPSDPDDDSKGENTQAYSFFQLVAGASYTSCATKSTECDSSTHTVISCGI